jgi:hypothetical protein
MLFAGAGFASAAGDDIIVNNATVTANLKVVGSSYLAGGLKLAQQRYTGVGTNDSTPEWNNAAVVVFPSAKAQTFNLGACANKPERVVTLTVKDTSIFSRTVNATSAEGILPASGGAKAPLIMRNYDNGDVWSATLYCDGIDWMVTSQEVRTAGLAV